VQLIDRMLPMLPFSRAPREPVNVTADAVLNADAMPFCTFVSTKTGVTGAGVGHTTVFVYRFQLPHPRRGTAPRHHQRVSSS